MNVLRKQKQELQQMNADKEQQIQVLDAKNERLERTCSTQGSHLQQKEKDLQVGEQLVSQCQQILNEKNKIISDLQHTLTLHERKIRQLDKQDTASSIQMQQLPVSIQKTTAVSIPRKDIAKMTWRERGNAPDAMSIGAVVVHGNRAYFTPADSHKVYSYQNSLGEEQWFVLPYEIWPGSH